MKKVLLLLICCSNVLISQTIVQYYDTAGSYTFTVPAGVTFVKVECWGGGGGGGANNTWSPVVQGGGGGGGAYSRIDSVSVIPSTIHTIIVGNGGFGIPHFVSGYPAPPAPGGSSSFDSIVVTAAGGWFGGIASDTTNGVGGLGGYSANCIGTIIYAGGNGMSGAGGIGISPPNRCGGGGGGSAGVDSSGNNAGVPFNYSGGITVTGGGAGGMGGHGAAGTAVAGWPGNAPGGGGGGSRHQLIGGDINAPSGGNGADGKVRITYTIPTAVGIQEINNQQSQIEIFPNPTTTTFTITSSDKIESIKVYNIIGELLFTETPNNTQSTINISQFSKGIYFAEIKTEKGIVRKKVVKE